MPGVSEYYVMTQKVQEESPGKASIDEAATATLHHVLSWWRYKVPEVCLKSERQISRNIFKTHKEWQSLFQKRTRMKSDTE